MKSEIDPLTIALGVLFGIASIIAIFLIIVMMKNKKSYHQISKEKS